MSCRVNHLNLSLKTNCKIFHNLLESANSFTRTLTTRVYKYKELSTANSWVDMQRLQNSTSSFEYWKKKSPAV